MKRTRNDDDNGGGGDDVSETLRSLVRKMEIIGHEVKIIRLKIEELSEKKTHPVPNVTPYEMPQNAYQARAPMISQKKTTAEPIPSYACL